MMQPAKIIKSPSKVITDSEDLLIEILLKLPIKCLLRLKCVSKRFHNIISDPQFAYAYHRCNPGMSSVAGLLLYKLRCPHHPDCNFVFLNGETPLNPLCSLSFLDAHSDIHRISSCNGLLCICMVSYGWFYSYEYVICNPTTSKYIRLPDLKRPLMSRILSMTIAFDPEKSPYYKVICVWVAGGCYRFSIYLSETKLWRDTCASLEISIDDSYLFKDGVFWNCSVHWVNELGPFLRLDMETECFGMMPMTSIPENESRRIIKYFGECGGRMHLIQLHVHQNKFFAIFELNRDYSEWIYMNRLNIVQPQGLPPGNRRHLIYNIELMFPNRDGSFGLVLSSPVGTFIFYLSSDRRSVEMARRLYDSPRDVHDFNWYQCHQYILTLAAV